ncbi:alpha-ketoglutarate-dependent dioxygenase AlkB [Tsukamurella sp. 8F]|uniref:alpha-ketoglutarate-dependent dioxygenase AlkB n=1 Tax=unclassified Tsukamurella TaxID=2633480 RepID=UPI0023B9DC2F|nr:MULTISPECIES: alpha-ketoglutarate-dependent dioxygenase AlkB [unclassified Tsukamurella]MDF0528495.1 alpha-ketoglutarate-dependent dioxygenase AlkB [Tsukamurella sp. 8J]MDF0586321.1 alpha-ketoglutarate-dependent dioxygenase AlkB [Tsukamurella sp. 8F]
MQESLFESAPLRRDLGDGAWLELRTGWLPDPDDVFTTLRDEVPWVGERRRMYDRVVDTPRLLKFYDSGATLPHPALAEMRDELSRLYWDDLHEPLTSVGLCLYRDGSDSVAWHGDTIGRGATHDTVVAIVSLGAARPFLLRPRSRGTRDAHGSGTRFGARSTKLTISHGDLLVMGGSCQRTWEHAVPKVSGTGPRISIQFRPRGVR